MLRRASLSRLIAFVTVAFVLMATFAPAISEALAAHSSHKIWVEMCSATGMHQMVQIDLGKHAPKHKHSGALEHCPFCTQHTAQLGPPKTDLPTVFACHTESVPPLVSLSAPRPAPAWTTAYSRAPPFPAC
jgi:hypothetical protein